MEQKWVHVPIRKSLVRLIDTVISKELYRSRAEFVADAIRRRLEEMDLTDGGD